MKRNALFGYGYDEYGNAVWGPGDWLIYALFVFNVFMVPVAALKLFLRSI